MDLSTFQEMRLRQRAARTGVHCDLACYYAVQRKWSEIEEIRVSIPKTNVHDRLVCELLMLTHEPGDFTALIETLDSVGDPWLFYTLAKHLLNHGRIEEAIRVARHSLATNPHDTASVNLVSRYVRHIGEQDLARLLIESSLGANPRQKDIENLKTAPGAPGELYLEPAPKAFDVSFYLPVYKVEKFMRFALEGIIGQNYPLKEVIVVNDASPDGSREIAEQYPVRIVDHDSNRGLAAARNTAFRCASGEFVGAVDTDAYPHPDYTRNILMEFENSDPAVAGAGGRFLEIHRERPADFYRSRYLHQDGGERRECPAPMLFGCNTLFRRAAVLAAGGYEEKYRTHGEDADLSRRLLANGLWLVYTPHAVAYHMRTDTPDTVLSTRWKYLFWFMTENGYYSSRRRLAPVFEEYLKACTARIRKDREEGYPQLLYLHLLMVVHNSFMDLNHGCAQGLFTAEEARYLEESILTAVEDADRRFRGALAPGVRRDTLHLLAEAASATPPSDAAFMERFNAFVAHLSTLDGTLDSELYALLCAARTPED